jgi:hypothetical protein
MLCATCYESLLSDILLGRSWVGLLPASVLSAAESDSRLECLLLALPLV